MLGEVAHRLFLLLEHDRPVGILERSERTFGLVEVIERLRRGDERAAIFAAGARIGLDRLAHLSAAQQLPGLVDHRQLGHRAVEIAHDPQSEKHECGERDRAQFGLGRQVRQLEHRESGGKIDRAGAFEEATVSPASKERRHGIGKIAGERRGQAAQGGRDIVNRPFTLFCPPDRAHRGID